MGQRCRRNPRSPDDAITREELIRRRDTGEITLRSDHHRSGSGPDPDRKAVLARRIRWFVAATITYNLIEAIDALSEGTRVSSTALIGFGLDPVIEVSSAAAVAWQFACCDHPAGKDHCCHDCPRPPAPATARK